MGTVNELEKSEKPFCVCHILSSLDGKINGAFFGMPECLPSIKEYANIRKFYDCKATLYGTTTMRESYSDGTVDKLPPSSVLYPKEDYIPFTDESNYVVSIDTQGILKWNRNFIEKKGRPKAHVIEVLTESVNNDYLAYLRERSVSYIFAGKEKLDCGLLLKKLKRKFSIERLMISGGGIINQSFLRWGLIDELSLVVAPIADGGNDSVSIFEKSSFESDGSPVAFELKEVNKTDGGVLWLRYAVLRKGNI